MCLTKESVYDIMKEEFDSSYEVSETISLSHFLRIWRTDKQLAFITIPKVSKNKNSF